MYTYEELQKLTRKELVEEYNKTAKHTGVGLNFWSAELERRNQDEQNERMLRITAEMRDMTADVQDMTTKMTKMTKAITICTVIILVLTLVNVAFVGWQIFQAANW